MSGCSVTQRFEGQSHGVDLVTNTARRLTPIVPALDRAITETVAYSDIFDYPLTAAEIHRYLLCMTATREEIDAALATDRLVPHVLTAQDGYVALAGREDVVQTRQSRTRDSERLWRDALRYGRIIASMPFVRMVAVTGELAMDNIRPDSDIDYFIVTRPGRLWLCRLLVIGVVYVAALRKVTICPNYLVSEHALAIQDRNLYTAHELTQMVPIAGHALYQRLREMNDWVDAELPNAGGPPRHLIVTPLARTAQALAERVLGTRIGARIERWEMNRKIRRLSRTAGGNPEASFSPDWCKGHVSGHERRILAAFEERLRALEEGIS